MSKTRMVNTRFWNDSYISELEPTEKLLFLYFLTNPWTNICGIYELPLKNVVVDTGIEAEKVKNILQRFALDQKILYQDGWVVIRNFIKHQKQGSPMVLKGIASELEQIPEGLRAYAYPIDTLSHLDSNLNLNSNLNIKPTASLDWLTAIPETELKELSEKYEASKAQITRKAETMKNYCLSKGKTYKNYRAFLEGGLDKDFGRRIVVKAPEKEAPVILSAEEQARIDAKKAEINAMFKVPNV